jgi:hypothetical protein
MITQAESGLSQEDYDALFEANADPVRRYTVERYNLNFSAVGNALNEAGRFFDAEVLGDALVRVFIEDTHIKVQRSLDGLTWGLSSAVVSGVGYVPLSIGVEDDLARIFYLDPSDGYIYHVESLDNGATWDSPVQVRLASTVAETDRVTHVAAPSPYAVYFNWYEYETGINYFGRSYEASPGVWDYNAPDWGWTAPLTGFDAIVLDDYDKTEIVVCSGQTMPLIGNKVEFGGLTRVLYPRGGIFFFTVTARSGWSVHKTLEVFDDWDEFQRRDNVHISKMNDFFFVTARGRDGTPQHYEESMRIFKSQNGIDWSRDTLAHVDTFYGAPLLYFEDKVHLVDPTNHYTSDSTAYTGALSAGLSQDITDYVERCEMSLSGIPSASLSMGNPDGALDDTLITSGETLRLRIEMGYWVDGNPIMMQRALMNIERVGTATDGVSRAIDVQARGIVTQMSDDMRSPMLVERQGQALGVDLYDDDGTETGYSGLRHTAVHKGMWKTREGLLYLASDNERGLAFSSFETDVQNGFVIAQMDWSKANEDEYVGLLFWAYDDSNYWCLILVDPSDSSNKFRIERVMNGRRNTEAEWSSGHGIELGSNWFIQVRMLYGLVDIMISDDGVFWQQSDYYWMPNLIIRNKNKKKEPAIKPLVNTGSVGLIGKGFAPEDVWPLPTYSPYPEIRYPGDDWDGPTKPPVHDWPPGTPKGDGLKEVVDFADVSYLFMLGDALDFSRTSGPFKPWAYRQVLWNDGYYNGIGGIVPGATGYDVVHFILDPYAPHWRAYFITQIGDTHTQVWEMTNIRGIQGQQHFRIIAEFDLGISGGTGTIRLHAFEKVPGFLIVSMSCSTKDASGYAHWMHIRNGYYGTWRKVSYGPVLASNPGQPCVNGIGMSPYMDNVYNGRMLLGAHAEFVSGLWESAIYVSVNFGHNVSSTPVWTDSDATRGLSAAQIIIPDLEDEDNDFWYASFATTEDDIGWDSYNNHGLMRYDNGAVTYIAPQADNFTIAATEGEYWHASWIDPAVWPLDYSQFVVYPGDHTIIAVIDSWGDFWRSTDAGDTWTHHNTAAIINNSSTSWDYVLFACTLQANPHNPLQYAITGQESQPGSGVKPNVWYTRDGGITWYRMYDNVDARMRDDASIDDATSEYFEILWWK